MTTFVVVTPLDRTVLPIVAADMDEALKQAGLRPGHVDHGGVGRLPEIGGWVNVVTYEYAVMVNPRRQLYFAIPPVSAVATLYGGTCLFYQTNEAGDTVDWNLSLPPIYFFADKDDVESAIAVGWLQRPCIKVNNRTLWRWPNPPPVDFSPEAHKEYNS